MSELTDYQRGVLAGLGIKTTQLRAVYAAICAHPGMTVYRLREDGDKHVPAAVARLQEAGLIELRAAQHPHAAAAAPARCFPVEAP